VTRLQAAALLVVTIVSAACATVTEPSIGQPQTVAPVTAAPSGPPTDVGDRHADPALEALLPSTLGGVNLVVESQRGTDLSSESEALDTMLKNLGRTLADFTLASAYSPAGDIEAQVGAWRVAGATPLPLLPSFVETVQASSATKLTVTELTVGGHAVTKIGAPGELAQGPLFAYAKDDVLLFVQTPDLTLAEEALSKMP
jgi:hypothetical protein